MTAEGLEHLAELCAEAAAYAEATGDAVLGAGLQLGAIAARRLARQERAHIIERAHVIEPVVTAAPSGLAVR